MWHRTLVSACTLGCLLGSITALCGDEAADKFVGTWKTKEKFAGFDQVITIAFNGGQWSIQGTFEKDGAVVGTFLGENARYADGVLTYKSKLVKKPVETWQDNETSLRLDGAAVAMSFMAKTGEKIVRAFARMPGVPKGVVKAEPEKPKTSEPAKPKLIANLEQKLVGTWKGSTGRFDEYWTVAQEGKSFKITGSYWKDGQEVGSCHGESVGLGQDHITFRRVFDRKPDPKLGNNTTYTLKAAEGGVELFLGSVTKGKGELLKAAELPKAVAAKEKPKDVPLRTFLGVWTGKFPGTNEQFTLEIIRNRAEWDIEAYVMSAENKRLAYFKQAGVKTDADGKSLSFTPKWVEKAAPITGEPALTLTSQPQALRAEFADPKTSQKVIIDLAKGDLLAFSRLRPPAEPKGRPTPLPADKTSTVQAFKLRADVPPAMPFAVLDAKQHVVAVAVSPDGKRVALGSQQITSGGFTADLAVWDLESQKQIWIKKKMIQEELVGMVTQLAFSGDGKILAARPQQPGEYPLRFFDAATGTELRSPAPLKMRVDCLAFHPSKPLLAVGTVKGAFHAQLELIDVRTGKSVWASSEVHHTAIDGLAFSPNGETIATVGRTADAKGYSVKLFDATKGTLIHDFGAAQKGIADSVVFSNDGKLVAAFFSDLNKPGIVIWDVASKAESRRITDLSTGSHGTSHKLTFLADNKTLAVACTDHHLHLFDVTTGQRVGVYPRAYGLLVRDVFAVGDGQMLLTSNGSKGVPLWKLSDALPPPK